MMQEYYLFVYFVALDCSVTFRTIAVVTLTQLMGTNYVLSYYFCTLSAVLVQLCAFVFCCTAI